MTYVREMGAIFPVRHNEGKDIVKTGNREVGARIPRQEKHRRAMRVNGEGIGAEEINLISPLTKIDKGIFER